MRNKSWLILAVTLALVLLANNIGITRGSLVDLEGSSGNTFQAWASDTWTQTTAGDFNAGVLTDVSTALSVDNVILSAGGSAGGANMILFWDGGAPPPGWSIVSGSGGDFYQRLPRGADAYGGTGGAVSHTHTVSLVSSSAPSATTQVFSDTTDRASGTHTHTLSPATTDPTSNLPVYRDLQVIKYGGGVPATIPAGAIAIFAANPGAGWTRYSAEDDYFVRGEASAGGTGGSNTHSHTASITLAPPSSYQGVRTNSTTTPVADTTHTHSGGGTTTTVDNRPPYITVILAKANASTDIPLGMITMFDAVPTGNWSVLSNPGGPFASRFVVGGAGFGATGGIPSHPHDNLNITVGGPSSTQIARTNNPDVDAASGAHTHSVTVSFATQDNLPPYIDVIFAQARYPASGKIASQVLDTGAAGARWDGLFWEETLGAGTDVTLEVRAADSLSGGFPDAAWVPVGGTSPVTTGLPSGRYMQWRATLTTADTSLTPVLHEVRVYYYSG